VYIEYVYVKRRNEVGEIIILNQDELVIKFGDKRFHKKRRTE